MLFLENLNMEVLVLMAGLMHDVNQNAAMVVVVGLGQILIMIGYGTSLQVVTMVGNALGSNKPQEALSNTKMVACVSAVLGLIVCFGSFALRSTLVGFYTHKESASVRE